MVETAAEKRKRENKERVEREREERRIEQAPGVPMGVVEKGGKSFPVSPETRGQIPREELEAQTAERQRQERIPQAEQEIRQIAEERGVFEQPVIEPLVPEGTRKGAGGVLFDIAKNVLGGGLLEKAGVVNLRSDLQQAAEGERDIAQEEFAVLQQRVKIEVENEISLQIDKEIESAEQDLISFGLPVGAAAGAVSGLASGTLTSTISEAIGDNRKIGFLDTALSQYTETIPTVSRSMDFGSSAASVFDNLDRMEAGVAYLESEIKLAAIQSSNVQISLRDKGIELRILKIREKIQAARREVLAKEAARAFGEVELPNSIAFLQTLQK